MSQAVPGSGLGITPWNEEEPPEIEGLPPSEDQPEPEEATESTQAEPEAPGVEEPAQDSTPEQRYAGRFTSVEALEQGYGQAESRMHAATQEAAELRRAVAELDARSQEQNQLLETLAPFILNQQLESNPELAEQLEQAQHQQVLAQQAQAPLMQRLDQMEAQRQAEGAQYALALTVQQWRSAHPDVPPNSDNDRRLADAVTALDLDIRTATPEEVAAGLDLAWEASANPHLMNVLRVNPHLIEIDGGIEEARYQAQMRATQVAPRQAAQAYVETGGQGAPTSGAPGASQDEFDEAIKAWNSERDSPLFR